jgi:Holliday junction resolvasome RuvABC endonuclease subunit
MRILGFDASSATVGYCVLDCQEGLTPKLVVCNFFKPLKKGGIFERLKDLKTKVVEILEEYKPDEVCIEEIMKFMPRASTATTIIALATVNRTVGLCCYEYTNKEPLLYSVMAIRHKLKLTKIFPKKDQIQGLIETHLGIKLETLYNRNGKIKPETGDIADACAVALYHWFKISENK